MIPSESSVPDSCIKLNQESPREAYAGTTDGSPSAVRDMHLTLERVRSQLFYTVIYLHDILLAF